MQVMLGLGMLAALLGDWALQPLPDNWRYMVGLPTVPALIMAGEFNYLQAFKKQQVFHCKCLGQLGQQTSRKSSEILAALA